MRTAVPPGRPIGWILRIRMRALRRAGVPGRGLIPAQGFLCLGHEVIMRRFPAVGWQVLPKLIRDILELRLELDRVDILCIFQDWQDLCRIRCPRHRLRQASIGGARLCRQR